jgi:hypothetical protein
MRTYTTRLVTGFLLLLIPLLPLGPAYGRVLSLPPACGDVAFSTEEDFVTQGPRPPDGNPLVSDGDLLGVGLDASGAVQCVICARNVDLLGQIFDVSVDLGLDAADVINAEKSLVAFSTELNSPKVGQFTAGDLLVTNGTIIPNAILTYKFPVGYDIGLDALHFVGDVDAITAFLDEAAQYSREQWSGDLLGRLFEQFNIDIWFSTEGTLGPVTAPAFLDGDLLSARSGIVVAANSALLPPGVPAGIPNRGVDFGLDAITAERAGDKAQIHFSTEILYKGEPTFTDGDVLRYGNGVVRTNNELIQCFEPKANFLGLDALHGIPGDRYIKLYLPLILKPASQPG